MIKLNSDSRTVEILCLSALLITALVVSTQFAATEPAPFAAGEELVFDVGWKAASAGNVVMKVVELGKRQSRPAYRIVLEANTNAAIDAIFKVRDRFESWFDAQERCTAGYAKRINEGHYRKQEDVFVNVKTGEFKARRMRPDKSPVAKIETGRYQRGAQDLLSLVYYYRGKPLQPGKTYPAVVVSGDSAFDASLQVSRREKITVPAGTFSCLAGEVLLKTEQGYLPHPKGRLLIWLTDDSKRLPVQIVAEPAFGRLEAKLRQKSEH